MRIAEVRKTISDGSVNLTGTVVDDAQDQVSRITFSYDEEYAYFVPENANPFVPVLLLPCMASGKTLVVDPPVSDLMVHNTIVLQDIWINWYPEKFKRVNVKALAPQNSGQLGTKTLAFFSLGVDSFYTLLKSIGGLPSVAPPVDCLVHMVGFQSRSPSRKKRHTNDLECQAVAKIARSVGMKPIIGQTNLRHFFRLRWGNFFHGAGLAGVAHSLSASAGHVLVPSTHSYRHLFPWGSHPLLDPLWSSETTRIIHDGSERDRAEKIDELVGRKELSLEHLRVCRRLEGKLRNCGLCSKCVRTMVTLSLIGTLERSSTFPHSLPLSAVRGMTIRGDNDRGFLEENLALACRCNADTKLVHELELLLARAVDQGDRPGRLSSLKRTARRAVEKLASLRRSEGR